MHARRGSPAYRRYGRARKRALNLVAEKKQKSQAGGRKAGPNQRKPVVLVIDVGGSKIKLRKSDSPHLVKSSRTEDDPQPNGRSGDAVRRRGIRVSQSLCRPVLPEPRSIRNWDRLD